MPVQPSDDVVVPKLKEGAKVRFEWAINCISYDMETKLAGRGAVI